jgi:hypothetical protein
MTTIGNNNRKSTNGQVQMASACALSRILMAIKIHLPKIKRI